MKKQIPLSVLIKLIGFYSLIIGIIGTILIFGISLTKQQSTRTPKLIPSPTGIFCGGIAGKQCPTKQTTWLVQTPANHTFVAPDNSFQFVYPSDWAYETIDGITPQQQHIVQLGRQLTQNERQALARQAGVELTDTLSGFSYTTGAITLYYTDTPVTKLEDLATGIILSQKDTTVDGVPALEVTVDCPTECVEILFMKDQQTFTFLQSRPRSESGAIDTTRLKQILSSFTFL